MIYKVLLNYILNTSLKLSSIVTNYYKLQWSTDTDPFSNQNGKDILRGTPNKYSQVCFEAQFEPNSSGYIK